jgi:hypothetical protein
VIELSRALLRQFRAVVRRALLDTDRRGPWPVVICRADQRGLSLEAFQGEVAVRHQQPGSHPPEVIAFPGAMLADMEGRGAEPVVLELIEPGKGRARWADGAVPRVMGFEAALPDKAPSFPEMPRDVRELPADFLRAFTEAGRSTANQAIRYGLTRIQLCGSAGQVVATDGKQLLVQSGFPFPWREDVLVPRLAVFGHRDVLLDGPVRVGRVKDVVVLECGPWTFWLRIDKDSRFPRTEQVIPQEAGVQSRLHLHPEDATFLAAALPKLPEPDDEQKPVTVDLCTPPAVRARGTGDGPLTEVILARSTVSGKSVRLTVDRRQLYRALKLGFAELQIVAADAAIACRDASRVFVFMPLSPEAALPPAKDAIRIASAEGEVAPPPPVERSVPSMPASQPHGNGAENNGRPEAPVNGLVDLITEAEAIRDVLHQATGRTARLVAALKQQRRQSRAVEQAMASLRQLQLGH